MSVTNTYKQTIMCMKKQTNKPKTKPKKGQT